jgi:predicted transcriptional regulator
LTHLRVTIRTMVGSSLEQVRTRLAEHKGRWPFIACEAGVPYPTLSKIAQGTTKNPRVQTVERLHKYLNSARFRALTRAPVEQTA